MSNCETYQAQLLEYLYDLLDPADRSALQDHLKGCPACQAALDQAQQQQQVIKAAAKKEFAGVRFVAPTEPPSISFPKKRSQPAHSTLGTWRGMALAASLLLALTAISGLGYKYGTDYVAVKRLVEDNRLALNNARSDQKRLQQDLQQLPMR
jgi:anti-sigma factor RsiW